MVDLTVVLNKNADAKTINQALKKASQGSLKGILGYCDQPLVSQDFVGARESSVLDATLTNVIDNTVKVVAWYDNEVGFSNRVLDLANHVIKNLK
jgi:glyceraldehyde-3-phosphate dehydrogenase/erythrose-4-phosphate dehydrogenase